MGDGRIRIDVRPLAVATLLLAASASAGAQRRPIDSPRSAAALTPEALERRLRIIANDSMMGRESGSEGDFKATTYIATEFARLGLVPAGEQNTYFQTVPFWRVTIDPRASIVVGPTTLLPGSDFLEPFVRIRSRTIDSANAIFAGQATDSTGWIRPAEASGRIVLLDVAPGTSLRAVHIDATRWPGAAAIALIAREQIGSEQASRLIEGRPFSDTSFVSSATPVLFISRHAADVLLGRPLASATPGAIGPTLTARVGFVARPQPYPARNVVAVLPGTDPKLRGEYVALTAHNDHVGFDHSPVDHDSLRAFNRVIRPMGADSPQREPTPAEWTRIHAILDSLRKAHRPRLDSIRNGADDDGSGTVSILAIADAMVHATVHPRRSILFVSHTGEEDGLLGSAWFTDHATVPLDSVVAEIDQDMVGRGMATDFPRSGTGAGGPTYLEVVGDQKISLAFAATLEAANARQPVPFAFDRSYAAPGHPLQYYCRADHYNYARYGIPAVALSRGEHLDYHQVTDESEYIDYPDMARVTRLVLDAAMMLANAEARPKLDVARPSDPHAPCRQ